MMTDKRMIAAEKTRNMGRMALCCGALTFALAFSASHGEEAVPSTVSGGPPIPGVCVLSREAVFDLSKVGQDVTAQFRARRDKMQAEVNHQEAGIEADIKTLEKDKDSLSLDAYHQRQQELVKRLQDLRSDAAKASQKLEGARQAAVTKIAAEAQPFVAEVYQRYRCSLLLSRDAVLAGNPGMDVTGEVIKDLNGKITTMPSAFQDGSDL